MVLEAGRPAVAQAKAGPRFFFLYFFLLSSPACLLNTNGIFGLVRGRIHACGERIHGYAPMAGDESTVSGNKSTLRTEIRP